MAITSLRRSKSDVPIAKVRKGLALPTTVSSGGPFETKSPEDTAWGDILHAIFTPRGARPMRRGYGSSLYDTLFGPLDGDPSAVHYAISESVARNAPHLRILSVNVEDDVATKGRFVTLAYSDADDPQPHRRRVLVPRTTVGPF